MGLLVVFMNSPQASYSLSQRALYGLLGRWAIPSGSRAKELEKVGHWQHGLYYQDILHPENPEMLEALRRLPLKDLELRNRRLKRAQNVRVTGKDLPKEQWTKPEEDVDYLTPYILEVLEERHDRATWRL